MKRKFVVLFFNKFTRRRKMKNTRRILGIIAIVAVMGFGFAACDTGGDGGGGNNGDNTPQEIVRWPEGFRYQAEINGRLQWTGAYTKISEPNKIVGDAIFWSYTSGHEFHMAGVQFRLVSVEGKRITVRNTINEIYVNGRFRPHSGINTGGTYVFCTDYTITPDGTITLSR